jgi:hypothetical protein
VSKDRSEPLISSWDPRTYERLSHALGLVDILDLELSKVPGPIASFSQVAGLSMRTWQARHAELGQLATRVENCGLGVREQGAAREAVRLRTLKHVCWNKASPWGLYLTTVALMPPSH